jgi:hypothetical protein
VPLKYSGSRRFSDSEIPPAKAPSSEGKDKIFSQMIFTILSDLCGLCVFAGDIPSFGCGCSPTGEPLFPSGVWEKACITIAQGFCGLRKFFDRPSPLKTGNYSRQDAKFGFVFSYLRAFASLREIIRVLVAGPAALCPSWWYTPDKVPTA